METSLKSTPPQWEGQEHSFLGYDRAVVHFIYSFSWDITTTAWSDLNADLKAKGWNTRQLHERAFSSDGDVIYSYQPGLVGQTKVLERVGDFAGGLTLLVPIQTYQDKKLGECRRLTVPVKYTIRLFDNGSGILTFSVHLSVANANVPAAGQSTAPSGLDQSQRFFQNIHWVLHLANNVDYGVEPVHVHSQLTSTFIQLPSSQTNLADTLLPAEPGECLTFGDGYCSLHDLFRRWLLSASPPCWAPKNAKKLWVDADVLNTNEIGQDFQTPYVFTALEVDRNSFLRFRRSPTLDAAREVGSILCKLTLDNRFILENYLNLSEDYIKDVLPYSEARGGLLNLCLDRRLFFAMSRRGAIALTGKCHVGEGGKGGFGDIPSSFVIPSFLNMCEILRGRWHIGCVVSACVDRAIAMLAGAISNTSNASPTPLMIMEEMVKWRLLSASFLRDPVPFLFDGGSVCEMAEQCERLLWLERLRKEVTDKFQLLDQLVRDYLNIDRHRRLRSAQ